MQRRHTACQWDGEAACLILIKCRGRVAQRPYVRLRSLAYVTCSRPRGSIGSPPGRGAEAYTTWSGHMSALDPRLALIKVLVFSIPESRDLAVSGPDPTQRGLDPIQRGLDPLCAHGGPGPYPEARSIHTGVRHLRTGSGPAGDAAECASLWTRGGTGPAQVVRSVLLLAQSSRLTLGRVMA
jgi:hypothetical protein